MQHIIKKQTIELDIDRRLDSFRIQESVSRKYWNSIVPSLQKTFDAITANEEILHVDRLVIELGELTEKSLLKDDWILELNSRLEKLIGELRGFAPDDIRVESNSFPLSIFRQWIFYMQNGYLHWNTLKADATWGTQVLGAMAENPDFVNELLNRMKNDSAMVNRVVAQHSDAFLLNMFQILTKQDQGILRAVLEVLQNSPDKKLATGKERIREFRRTLWIKMLTGSAQGTDVSVSYAGSQVRQFLNSRNLPMAILERIDKIIPDITTPGTYGNESFEPDEKQSRQIARKTIKPQLSDEGIFTVNAGLVLLHPFINSFFKRLQMVKDNAFPDRMIWQKALYLLHYLATGNTEAAEHELVIPRVLCAYPGEETVDRDITVSPAEIKEAENMLKAAISQWEILKNTSIAGLREGFLQRSGKLFTREDNLYLQIETSGVDVLLDQLPWSLGMIKLPWMERILRVEWR